MLASCSGVPYRDLTSGFKAFRRGVLEKLDMGRIHASGYSFQIEMTYRSHQKGTVIREIPIIFNDRTVGTSKMTGKIVLEAMLVVWKLRFTKPAGRRRAAGPRCQEPLVLGQPTCEGVGLLGDTPKPPAGERPCTPFPT